MYGVGCLYTFSDIMVIQNTGSNQEKRETVTNITIQKITESIYYYIVLEVTDDEGEINLLINIRYTVVVAEPNSPILNTPHYTSLVLCETNVRDP